uniref:MPMNPADYFSRGTVYIPTRDS n=1 Tax=Stichopus japonicus TaxID=307972 RepID=A0A2U8RLN1_STIJA|nr:MPMNPADYFSRGTVYIPTRDS precursor [Apostichopus japonicus]
MHFQVLTRTLLLFVCLCFCIAAVTSMPMNPADYFSRGTVYIPTRDSRSSVPVEPGMMGHMCVYHPNFYCMCTSNGFISFCQNHSSSFFSKK